MRLVFEEANLYRTGGDEFVIISSQKSQEEFLKLVRTLKDSLAKEQLPVAVGAQWQESAENLRNLITLADRAMYEDKQRFYETTLTPNPLTRRPRDSSLSQEPKA